MKAQVFAFLETWRSLLRPAGLTACIHRGTEGWDHDVGLVSILSSATKPSFACMDGALDSRGLYASKTLPFQEMGPWVVGFPRERIATADVQGRVFLGR